eukprot:SAG31_NODE_16349_length_712_cov_1.659054_1_plen_135_part_00
MTRGGVRTQFLNGDMATAEPSAVQQAAADFAKNGYTLLPSFLGTEAAVAAFADAQESIAAEWAQSFASGRITNTDSRGLPTPHAGHEAHKIMFMAILEQLGEPFLAAVERPDLLALARRVLGCVSASIAPTMIQ